MEVEGDSEHSHGKTGWLPWWFTLEGDPLEPEELCKTENIITQLTTSKQNIFIRRTHSFVCFTSNQFSSRIG